MDLNFIDEIFSRQPKYRLTQAMKAVYEDLISDWSEATNLPLALRQELNEKASLKIDYQLVAGKSSRKALVSLAGETAVEAVLLSQNQGRETVCISVQAGCPMGCRFCATGKLGLKRNLSAEEMVEQVLIFARLLKAEGKKVSNVVYMGMGEPFLNYDEVLRSVAILHDKLGLGARRLSISTCGVVPAIKRLAKERFEVNLAISLHAPNDQLRSSLMPVNDNYPLKELFRAIDYYVEQTNRQVMYEYIMLAGINDGPKEARELSKLLAGRLAVVNLIPYNGKEFKASKREQREQFKKILGANKIRVIERASFGQEIDGACGMLAGGKKSV